MTGPRDTVSQAASITPVTAVAYYLHPPRFKYHLTEAGRELFPVLLALQDWGDTWAVAEPAVQLVHDCGHPPHAVPACRHCGAPVTPESVTSFSR